LEEIGMRTSDRRAANAGRRLLLHVACTLAGTLGAIDWTLAQDSGPPSSSETPAAAPPGTTTAPTTSGAPTAASAPPPAPAPATPAPTPAPPAPVTPLGEKPLYERPKNDITSLNASAGASFNTGSTRAYQLTAGGDFRLVRNPHGVGANVAFAYGRADVPQDTSERMLETIKNLNAKARYDFFFSQYDAVFLATGYRWDPFAGIERRNQGLLGYLRYFVVEEKQRFWGELGYDLTSDRYRQLPMQEPPNPRSTLFHSARLFVGYDNQLNEAVTYLGGVELLVDVEKPKHVRVNLDNALRSALNGAFKLELKFRLAADGTARSDRRAPPIDTATLISLLYTLI
jgi:hypothetical protein